MSSAPVITGIHTVGVPVSDQDQALRFYTGTLGLSVRMDVPMGDGHRWIEVIAEGAPTQSR
jgi:lactoylglutathione lyase